MYDIWRQYIRLVVESNSPGGHREICPTFAAFGTLEALFRVTFMALVTATQLILHTSREPIVVS